MRRAGLFFVGLVIALAPAPALGHGDLQGTDPADGARVKEAPTQISVTLTEAPTRGAEARALDGCKRKVPTAVSVEGSDIILSLRGGEPGRWTVSYRAVSSVDGHQTRGRFGFTVSGKKDCSRDEPQTPGDDIDAADDPGIIENPNPPEEGGTSWLLWVGIGTVVLVAGALVLRRSSR